MPISADRRALLAAAVLAPLAPHVVLSAPTAQKDDSDSDTTNFITGDASLVETSLGKVRGYRQRGVHVFKGVPYAGAPTGEQRFGRAPKRKPWTGVRNAYSYGPICPQVTHPGDESDIEWTLLLPRGQASAPMEDCLRINLWSRGLGDSKRRPVMLWIHAQGFMGGSSQDFLATDGLNLARTQDVVVASINHRIGPLGFMHLGDLAGDAFADSGNVGMLDIIDALRWLRDNAVAFGGDPDNITVFGQSGGGFKISVLLAMPEAKGLFHKAIIQSGARPRVQDRAGATALAAATLDTLGIDHANAAKLRDIPIDSLIAAVAKSTPEAAKRAKPPTDFRDLPSFYWMPVAGTPSLPAQPWYPAAPEVSAHVPIIVMTTMNELSPSVGAPELENMTWDACAARLQKALGERTAPAIAAARTSWPGASPVEIVSIIESRNFRLCALELCQLRAASGGAPIWNAIFAWNTATFDGRPRAFHTADVPFVFANADLVPQISGGGERGRRMAARMSGLWANFARTGVPAFASVPTWKPASSNHIPTMLLSDNSVVMNDPDLALTEVLSRS